MDLGLKDKVALVTGASRGIGAAIAEALGREGARLAIVSRSPGSLAGVADHLLSVGVKEIASIAADLSSPAGVETVIETTREHFGRIDILVNNAGAIRTGPFLDLPDQYWVEDWNLKPLSYVRMARAVFPVMQAQGGGRIINIAGAAARNPLPVYLAGGAANAAIITFTKGLAALGAGSRILVTAVSPGATRTQRLEDQIKAKAAANNRSVEEEWAAKEASYPLGRIARPEDIGGVVCFLASTQASFITGVCITVDGGASQGVYL